MTDILDNATNSDCAVEMTCVDGDWLVRVVDNGQQSVQRFSVASHARAFADGQKIRLGLSICREQRG